MVANNNSSQGVPDDSLLITDYVEAVLLILACLLGLVGNLAALNVSLKIRNLSRHISLLFCVIICADAIICATRIPVTVYLILSRPLNYGEVRVGSKTGVEFEHTTLALTISSNLSTGSTDFPINVMDFSASTTDFFDGNIDSSTSWTDHATGSIDSASATSVENSSRIPDVQNRNASGLGGFFEIGTLMATTVGQDGADDAGRSQDVDMACEVWSASGAILMTIVWLHLVAGTQRFYIIFSFSKYRKIFTQTLITGLSAAAWLLGIVFVFAPIRGFGLLMERAGRGACRPGPLTPEGVLWVRGVTSAALSGLPLLLTVAFYCSVMHSVWLASKVRREALEEFNRVIVVTLARVLSLCLTYFPLIVLAVLDISPGLSPDIAHRYIGYLLFAQSVISPFITLQDNDFREKTPAPTKNGSVRNGHGHGGGDRRDVEVGSEDGGMVLPNLGCSDGGGVGGGSDAAEGRRNSHPQLQRTISCITSADLRTLRGSTD